MLKKLLNLLFQPRCLSCHTLVNENGTLCHICWGRLKFISEPSCTICNFPFEYDTADNDALCASCSKSLPAYDRAKSVMLYNDYSSRLVTNLKYGDKTNGVPRLAKWMTNNNSQFIKDIDYIIPVPIHRIRLWHRKYNQSALLGKEIAKLAGKEFNPHILRRIKHTPPQASLNYKQRKNNIRGCFAINSKNANMVKDASILIVDDVITTGATVEECAKILKKSGAKKVKILTLAKTVR